MAYLTLSLLQYWKQPFLQGGFFNGAKSVYFVNSEWYLEAKAQFLSNSLLLLGYHCSQILQWRKLENVSVCVSHILCWYLSLIYIQYISLRFTSIFSTYNYIYTYIYIWHIYVCVHVYMCKCVFPPTAPIPIYYHRVYSSSFYFSIFVNQFYNEKTTSRYPQIYLFD